MADQQSSYTVPPAPEPKRRLLRVLPWSRVGIVLTPLYLILVLAVWADDLGCRAHEVQMEFQVLPCWFDTFILTSPSAALVDEIFDLTGGVEMLLPILLNTLLVYLIGAGLGRIGHTVFKALRR